VRVVYADRESPYRALLALAGCEYGDLERLVKRDGVEEALRDLFAQGVYLTVDEFKGRRPVVRRGVTIAVDPRRLRNPAVAAHVAVQTGGSRGPATPVPIDLAFLRDRAVNTLLALDARGGGAWVKAHWQVPGAGALARLVEFSGFGAPVARWFTQVDPAAPGLHPRYRWSARLLRWGSLLAGAPLPRPIHVPLDRPLPIARWMDEVRHGGQTPHLFTFASSAVRLCQAAADQGVDLHGVQFTVTGEPLTAARLAVIRRCGAEAVPRYAIMECGAIGLGCLRPEAADDVHLLHDLHAVIQPDPRPGASAAAARPLYVSSIGSTAPFVLVNVSMGDQAVLTDRRCGCALEGLGWPSHLHTVRSHEKLTAGGMTLLDTDVIRVLEEVLPARFGGVPTDYQLVEDESSDGRPRLDLLVHPAVGPVDPAAVAQAFLDAVGAGSGVERVTRLLWGDAGLLRVERRPPRITGAGKILHLHARPAGSPSSAPSSTFEGSMSARE
ncbi:MAG: hypothetical protein ACREJR_12750, partial [Candidatus Rokuibacteriota bacterium]